MDTTQLKLVVCISNAKVLAVVDEICTEIGLCRESASRQDVSGLASFAGVSCVLIEFDDVENDSIGVLQECLRAAPEAPFVALLAQPSSSDVSRLMRLGAFDCLDMSATRNEILQSILSARTQFLSSQLQSEAWRQHLVGESSSIAQVSKVIRLIAGRRCTVLISGETGTGKEMAARAIHLASDRARKPLVAINCSAIPENLVEAELFGHVKGAFTGAITARLGRFEQAHGGTLFLDEIADLPLDLQAKLLRVLQERELQRLGSAETVKLDVRVIAATNADLTLRIQQGRFREDLFYRLNVVPIHMPPLRERTGDIALLTQHFVKKVCNAEGISLKRITPEAAAALTRYAWPGNVRQLENAVEHAVIMSGDREYLYPSDFAIAHSERSADLNSVFSIPTGRIPEGGLNYTEALREFERTILHQALNKAQGNKTLAADMLQLPRTTLLHKLRALDQAAA